MRVVVDAALGTRDADLCEPRDRELARLARRHVAVQHHRLDQLVADGEDRVQRRHRVLEDHRDLASAQ